MQQLQKDPRENDIGFMIKQLNDSLEKKANEDLQANGLTLSQLRVMSFIAGNGFQTTQKEIEDHLEVSHPTVNGLLKRLEAKGKITTELSTNGRLSKIVRMTETGKRENKEADKGRIKYETVLGSCLTESERETLIMLLKKLQQGLASSTASSNS